MADGSANERRRGRCKWFNVAKGWGFITPDDQGAEVFVHQSVIRMNGFRSLGEGEDVEFESKISDKGVEATIVTGNKGAECRGSLHRPVPKKRFRKIRCFNCGEVANHIAAKCTSGPLPKRCHHCKSQDHLIANCPTKPEKQKSNQTKANPKDEKVDTKDDNDNEQSATGGEMNQIIRQIAAI